MLWHRAAHLTLSVFPNADEDGKNMQQSRASDPLQIEHRSKHPRRPAGNRERCRQRGSNSGGWATSLGITRLSTWGQGSMCSSTAHAKATQTSLVTSDSFTLNRALQDPKGLCNHYLHATSPPLCCGALRRASRGRVSQATLAGVSQLATGSSAKGTRFSPS